MTIKIHIKIREVFFEKMKKWNKNVKKAKVKFSIIWNFA